MNDHRDALVGDALRSLDVPDHGPDFWDRLETSLSGAPAEPATTDERDHDADDNVVELAVARSARATARRRPGRVPAVAAAVAVVAAIALAVGLPAAQQAAERGDEQVDMANAPGRSSVPDPSAPVTSEPLQTEPAPSPSPAEVATDWLTLLRDGDVEQAYALLDDASQESLTPEEFGDMATGLAEGAASFADLEAVATPLIDDEGLAATAVVFTGDVEREGMVETASYAVVVTGDPEDPSRELGVGFSLDGPILRAETTDPGQTQTSPVEVTLSPTAGASWAVIDGSIVERIDTARTGSASIDVEALAGPGTHTVAIISTEGGLYSSGSSTVVIP